MEPTYSEYLHNNSGLNPSHEYLPPIVKTILSSAKPSRVIGIGCGNGSVASFLTDLGHEVIGVGESESSIAQAQANFPNIRFEQQSAYSDLGTAYGKFPALIALEIIEHLYSPRQFMETVTNILEPEGIVIISTPYHGYIKNLALALTGKFDAHFTALWEGGHIKLWSIRTLSTLIEDAVLIVDSIYRVGRVPPLAKSMILVARKPAYSPQNASAKGTSS